MKLNMKPEINNDLYIPLNDTRILRAIKGDEYYDVAISTGSSGEQREWIADHIKQLSTRQDRAPWEVFNWDYIVLGWCEHGRFVDNNGEMPATNRTVKLKDGKTKLTIFRVDPKTYELSFIQDVFTPIEATFR